MPICPCSPTSSMILETKVSFCKMTALKMLQFCANVSEIWDLSLTLGVLSENLHGNGSATNRTKATSRGKVSKMSVEELLHRTE